jgi:hypothetical protein
LALEYNNTNNEDMRRYCKAMVAEANAFVGGFAINHPNDAPVLSITPSCDLAPSDEYHTALILSLPADLNATSIKWIEADGGEITFISEDRKTIHTNGKGSYTVTAYNGSCSYGLSFDYKAIPVDEVMICPPPCNPIPFVVSVDTTGCTVRSDTILHDATYVVEVLHGQQWVVVAGASMPFTPSSNGSYRVTMSNGNCTPSVSNTVEVTCSTPCTPINVGLDTAGCALVILDTMIQGATYAVEFLHQNQWITISNAALPYSADYNGSYRVTQSFGYCVPSVSNMIAVSCADPCPPVNIMIDTAACTIIAPDSLLQGTSSYTVEYLYNNQWMTLADAGMPFTPQNNGTYRVTRINGDCEPMVSAPVEVVCAKSCVEESVDLIYVESEQKFLHFYKHETEGETITSEWISPTSYQSVSNFLTWINEDIIIRDITIDATYHIYVFGSDPTNLTRTRIIKYNYNTLQVIWSQWVENFTYISYIPWTDDEAVLSICGGSTTVRKYRIDSGTFVSATPHQWKGTLKVYTGLFENVSWVSKTEYTYVPLGGSDITYVSPTTAWKAPLPAIIRVRNVVKTFSNRIVVGGEFSGTFTINGTTYTSGGWTSLVFITYSQTGQLISVIVRKATQHQVLKTFATDGYYKYAYTAYTTTDTSISDSILSNIELLPGYPGLCVEVGGFEINDGGASTPATQPTIAGQKLINATVYPNPFNEEIRLIVDAVMSEQITVQTYDNVGHLIKSTRLDANKGRNEFFVNDFAQLPASMYTIRIITSEGDEIYKVIKL